MLVKVEEKSCLFDRKVCFAFKLESKNGITYPNLLGDEKCFLEFKN